MAQRSGYETDRVAITELFRDDKKTAHAIITRVPCCARTAQCT